MRKMLLLMLLLPFISFGQYQKEIDSIKSNIKSRKNIEDKRADYLDLIGFTIDNGLDADAKNAIAGVRKLNINGSCLACEATALYGEGSLFSVSGDFKNAIPLFEKSAILFEKVGKTHMYLESTVKRCESLMFANEVDQAEKILLETIKNHKDDKVQIGMQGIYYLLACIYYEKKYYNSALNYFFETEKSIQPNHPNAIQYKIIILSQIATIYKDQNNYSQAIEKINAAYAISIKEKLDVRTLEVIETKGDIENYFNHPEKAIPILNKSLAKSIALQRPININKISLLLGESYCKMNQYNTSIAYLKKCEAYYKENLNENYYSKVTNLLAKDYLKTNHTSLFQLYLNKSEKLLADKHTSADYIFLLEVKIEAAIQNNQSKNLVALLTERDSLTNIIQMENSKISFQDVETKYQTEKKEQQIKLLSTQNELAKKQKYMYLGLLLLLVFIAGIAFYGYRNKIKTARKLNELNALKSQFFANISHEFRTPLTLIKSPVQSLQSEIIDENQKSKLNLIATNATRMLELVDQLLALSKIDSGNLKLILKEGNVGSFLNAIVEPFEFQAQEKNIHFDTSIQKTTDNNSFDKDVIEKIVTNLLTNAFKYTPEHEKITFTSSVTNNKLQLIIANSGSDVTNENLPKFFERFYQKSDESQGVGIGLALVKELVELYKGTIETHLGEGKLSFIINLPLQISNEKAVVIPTKSVTPVVENQITNQAELPILLLVDDNADIRSILKDIFKEQYTILEAQDGEEALQMAQKEIPDCIISDVMMPNMDGFEFTAAIKNTELTSFIPVILLTAKTSDQAHLEGLKSTADAFLTKPFNNDIVKATVEQLIAERKKLHLRYSQELVLKPVDIVINSVEEKFITKLQLILEKEVSNSEFSSEDFATAVGMSRMQLHRKLKSLLGVSATEFLRNERLKIAADLLQKGNGNISEIAYAVGFNDVSYFSKCFKEMFLVTPSEYLNSKNTL